MCEHKIKFIEKGTEIEVPDGNFDPPIRFVAAEGFYVCEKCGDIPRSVSFVCIALEMIATVFAFIAAVGLAWAIFAR